MIWKSLTPRSLFRWIGVVVVGLILLTFMVGTRVLFVAGAIILLGFSFGVVQSAIELYRSRPKRGLIRSAVDLLPYASVLLLAAILLFFIGHEFLRK